jgi:hypothetical protein
MHPGPLNNSEADLHQQKFSMTLLSRQSFPSLYIFLCFIFFLPSSFLTLAGGDKAAAAATGLTFLCA